ncbi:MAG: putative extracellular nuclease [Bacteriovoracaceae bacterium]|jgi:predicted extracellular nuclease
MKTLIATIFLSIMFGCDNTSYDRKQENTIITGNTDKNVSSTAGNLVASAIKEVHELDMVFYPKTLINPNVSALLAKNMTQEEISNLLSLYPEGSMDQFHIGNMSGKDIKNFLFQRTTELFSAELEVAGARYNFKFDGGFPLVKTVVREDHSAIKDSEFYKVAISKYYYFSGDTFPSYKYRNSIERVFQNHFIEVSARDSVKSYISNSNYQIPFLKIKRAIVSHTQKVERGFVKISEIQGQTHLSKMKGDIVTVRAIVTAEASVDWYPGGTEYYLQEEEKDWDTDSKTSEGIHLYISNKLTDMHVGDKVEVTAQVYEEISASGLTRTQLRNIKSYKVISSGNSLPRAIIIGENGVEIPKEHVSTYSGNINNKKSLKLSDGIDFWESFEGMRVTIQNPRVMGFRGGKESSDPFEMKSHLTLYVLPDGHGTHNLTRGGGIMPNPDKDLWNPNLLTIASGNLTKDLNPEKAYNVGEVISGKLTGIIRYTKNLFGDGEYNFIIPTVQDDLITFNNKSVSSTLENCIESGTGVITLACRPEVSYKAKKNKLTIASYNLKNLSGNDQNRIEATAQMFKSNLHCPDIIGLVEVQDDNGLDYAGNSDASSMLDRLIDAIPCGDKSYKALNINPQLHTEGGQPGGNIRVAMLYDVNRVSFNERLVSGPRDETTVLKGGVLSNNPGRIFPNDKAFARTRKSIIAQFGFEGEDVYVVVNHFNSKLGDSGHWGAVHPVVRGSETRRAKLAYKMNEFISLVERRNPNANIAVIGDFNAYLNEGPMKILEGNILYNLMRDLPENMRYTTNHNGNSQSLDYIFVNKGLRKKSPEFNVLHLNSDYMGRLSDHDPVSAAFQF